MTELSRRRLLTLGGLSAGALLAGAVPGLDSASAAVVPAARQARTLSNLEVRGLPSALFQLGVASGDPWPDSVVLWTRLAPDPLDGGGMPDRVTPVEWEIATDERFSRTVRRGTAFARPEAGHSVHVEPRGLRPGSAYFYRFRAGGEISPVGRTRTAPAAGRARAASGWRTRPARTTSRATTSPTATLPTRTSTSWRSSATTSTSRPPVDGRTRGIEGERRAVLAGRVPQPVRPLQDRHRPAGGPRQLSLDRDVRRPRGRQRLGRWRTPGPRQAAAGGVPGAPDRGVQGVVRAHAGTRLGRAGGSGIQAYRRFEWGDLARIHVLDTRQYRTDQATTPDRPTIPARTMTVPPRNAGWSTGSRRAASAGTCSPTRCPSPRPTRRRGRNRCSGRTRGTAIASSAAG